MLFRIRSKRFLPERYRSGHNGADSKSDGGLAAPRGFESHPLRQLSRLDRPIRFFSYAAFLRKSDDLQGGAFWPSYTSYAVFLLRVSNRTRNRKMDQR